MKYAVLIALIFAAPLTAATLQGNPSNYQTQLAALQPGDTLQLAGGSYDRLNINGLHGNSGAWITIEGPATGTPATIEGASGSNTVQLRDCSFLALKDLTVDSNNIAGADGIKAQTWGSPGAIHDILIENCTIVGCGNGQQTVGISTKCPCYNWTIRGCEITGAGTGMYLGNSNGEQPFIRGIIESNRVYDPEGYCIQIKGQIDWPTGIGLPSGNGSTVIRNNVLIKTNRASGSGDRPNLLVDGFPDSGTGSSEKYEIYGNFIADNPRESLIQATGRFSIHDNILVDAPSASHASIFITTHGFTSPTGPVTKTVKLAHVYHNTIYDCARGIRVASGSTADDVVGNIVFSANAISGTVTNQSDNITDSVANAGNYVANPSTNLASMDFYPLNGQCTGSAINMTPFNGDAHFDLDFNDDSKGSFDYRGAYAGSGANPGWTLGNGLKQGGPGTGPTTPPALAITNPAAGALPNATENVSYSRSFTAAGGTGPYTWNIPLADIPAGLSFDTSTGVLSGAATTLGSYSFTVTVTDTAAGIDSRNYTLDVVPVGTGTTPSGSGSSSSGGGCVAGAGSAIWLLALPLMALRQRRD